MPLFYTGKGDDGSSSVGSKKYPKDSPVLWALGDLDELNSFLGLVKASLEESELRKKIEIVQKDLFIIQANVSWFIYPEFSPPQLTKEKVEFLEKEIKGIENRLAPERGFIIPGGTLSAAWLDAARTIARRAERRVVVLAKDYQLPEGVLGYLNRLSSYLYALARAETAEKSLKEERPDYR
ncbi:MAG TPA: cob(I)yrinic acid a,c-diamide adenosyltransferase [Candidatus Tyrphobacter sp.]|nr:cob(I)yrinic acid a,c-diamide adenosyltransferase [Candidatus Tyrphobacter sp.]